LYTEQGRESLNRHHRAGEDYRGTFGKQRQRFLHGEQQAAHIRIERPIEMLLGDLSQRGEFVDPGIRRQHVDMPGLRFDGCVDAVEIGEVGGIALDRRGIAADRGHCLIQFGLMAAGDKHSGAFLGKMLSDAEANAGAAARDDSDFACKLPGHGEVSCDCATPMAASSSKAQS
jgi:hypothetical protein